MDTTDELDAKLAQFESIIDKSDPEQVKMFEEMKRHTALLKHGRGEWEDPKNRTFRTYNEPGTAFAAKRLPMESEAYRNYKNHVLEENQSLLSIARGEEVPRITAPGLDASDKKDVLSSRPKLLDV
jgi:hypothetical protein